MVVVAAGVAAAGAAMLIVTAGTVDVPVQKVPIGETVDAAAAVATPLPSTRAAWGPTAPFAKNALLESVDWKPWTFPRAAARALGSMKFLF